MTRRDLTIESKPCILFIEGEPECLIVQPIASEEHASIQSQAELIAQSAGRGFALAAFAVDDWNVDLSPWEAPAVFGNRGFGHGAGQTLSYVTERLIPELRSVINDHHSLPVIIGGYSLAGLFALWAAYESDEFAAACAVSPSVWFPGWLDHAKAHEPKATYIYLSLGDREEKTKNPVMATVGDCIRKQYELLGPDRSVLEWNPGNHFKDPELRCAKGFKWCMEMIEKKGQNI